MTNTFDMETVVRIADYAAAKNDRWLFIATLIVTFLSIFFFVRWIMGRYDQLMREHRGDQQQFSQTILQVVNENNKASRELSVVLDRVSTALRDTETELRRGRSLREERQQPL